MSEWAPSRPCHGTNPEVQDPANDDIGSINSHCCLSPSVSFSSILNLNHLHYLIRIASLSDIDTRFVAGQLSMRDIRQNSATLSDLIDSGDVLLCGGIYNVESGEVAFVEPE